MVEPVRIAVIGLGRMGAVHVSALGDVEEIAVVALADVRSAALAAASELHPKAATYRDPGDAIRDETAEAVLLATPTPTHPELVDASLEAGKHVLCEKPLALDPMVSDELGARAAASGLVLQVGFWRRFSPPWRTARDAIVSGRIGTPVLLRLSQWDADPPPAEFCDPAVSGGLAVDCGVHEFDLAEWLTGRELVEVRADALPIVADEIAAVGDVDNLLAVAELEGGAKVVVDLSRNARYGEDVRSEVLGSDGAVFVELLPEGRSMLGTAAGITTLAGSQTAPEDPVIAGLRGQAAAFARAVRGEAVDRPGAFASSRAVRAAIAVNRSLRTGAPVPISG
jgi:predicted dehydrogenase